MDVQGETELQGREMDSVLSKRENMICTSPKIQTKYNCQCNGAEKGWVR